MIDISVKINCCGCGACAEICKVNAIQIEQNEKGFYYPVCDEDLCVQCGLCVKVCAFQENAANSRDNSKSTIRGAYAMQHCSDAVVKNSSSGGFFTAISDYVLDNGGYVCGAVVDKSDMKVKHILANTTAQRDCMRGSKYVQSDTTGIFEKIKNVSADGTLVLFTGTPCQCAQLSKYLGKKRDNVILVDLFCHGAPSPLLFQEHIALWEQKKGKKAVAYHFRDKSFGYEYTHKMVFEDGSHDKSIELKRLLKMYTLSMRESCYVCPYASRQRYGDFSIGDLWESGAVMQIYDHKGMSTVLVNTDKAEQLLEKIKPVCKLLEMDPALIKQNALAAPVQRPDSTDRFWKCYFTDGYHALLDRYGKSTVKSKVYQSMLRVLHRLHLGNASVFLKSKVFR